MNADDFANFTALVFAFVVIGGILWGSEFVVNSIASLIVWAAEIYERNTATKERR